MTIINQNGARILTRDELLSRLQGVIKPKAKRDKFERLRQSALSRAEHVIDCRFAAGR